MSGIPFLKGAAYARLMLESRRSTIPPVIHCKRCNKWLMIGGHDENGGAICFECAGVDPFTGEKRDAGEVGSPGSSK